MNPQVSLVVVVVLGYISISVAIVSAGWMIVWAIDRLGGASDEQRRQREQQLAATADDREGEAKA